MPFAIPGIAPLPSPEGANITLWLVDLDGPDASGWNTAVLSAHEQDRAQRFRFEIHARRYRASHVALRQILARATGLAAAELLFTDGAQGKPRLAHADAPQFNLSHSAGWALIGTCGSHPIGVDIEVIKPMLDAADLAKNHFSATENAAFSRTPPELQLAAFFSGWTRKEACLKAVGSGLMIEPHTFEAGLDTAPRATTIQAEGQACAMQLHSLTDLPVENLAAAVARLVEPRSPGRL